MLERSRKLFLIITIISIPFTYAALALVVDNSITPEDEGAIATLGVGPICSGAQGIYEREIECILAIQNSVLRIGRPECADSNDTIEPAEFLRRNYGCCFDRARFIEKAARFYGFETRHVFIIEPHDGLSFTNALPLRQSSHAASEIYTSRGWLGVDSVEPFILLSEIGEPTTYRVAIDNLDRFPSIEPQSF